MIDTTDPKGQLIHRVYDHLARLTSLTTPDNTITIAYDAVGNPTSFTNYLYDLAGRLTTLTPPAGAAMNVSLSYDPAGRLANITYPNGVVSAYGYDGNGRLNSLSHTLGANPSFASFGYTYNPVGNILAILDQVNSSENRTHTYDALQRLRTGGTVANAESYAYDLVGNRTTSSLSNSHTHDDLNRLLEDDSYTYTYDDNGNLETKTDKGNPTQITTYHWDAQDQLIQIDRPDSTTTTYKYDGLGRRIEKDVAGSITRYVYDGADILLEFDGTNTFGARYSHGDQVDQPLILQKAGIGHLYYHHNHQGSISHITNNSGTVVNSYAYDSYGIRISVIESVIQPYSYTGREYDVESGLYFYRARYYDANTGRFLSEDPIRFRAGDQNFYNYVFNNPVNLTDPDGRIFLLPQLIGGGLGAGFAALGAINSGAEFGDVAQAAAVGFASGALSTLGGGPLGSAAVGALAGGLGNLANQALSGNPSSCSGGLDFGSALGSAGAGLAGGLAGNLARGLQSIQGFKALTEAGQDFVDSFTSGLTSGVVDIVFN